MPGDGHGGGGGWVDLGQVGCSQVMQGFLGLGLEFGFYPEQWEAVEEFKPWEAERGASSALHI